MGHIPVMDVTCATLGFIDGLGGPEMMLVFVLVLLLFGGQKLPEFARGLGKSIREFKKAASGVEEEFKRALEEDERKQAAAKYTPPAVAALPPAPTTTPPTPADDYHHDYSDPDHYDYHATDGNTAAPATEKKPDDGPAALAAETPATAAPAVAESAPPPAPESPVAAPETPERERKSEPTPGAPAQPGTS